MGLITNDAGSKWVYLCRYGSEKDVKEKKNVLMAVIGYKPTTGDTCFFTNTASPTPRTGTFFTSPQKLAETEPETREPKSLLEAELTSIRMKLKSDNKYRINADTNPNRPWNSPSQMVKLRILENRPMMEGADCVRCHQAYPFINSAFVNARRFKAWEAGQRMPYGSDVTRPVPPNFGLEHRHGQSPYKIVGLEEFATLDSGSKASVQDEWQPKHLVHKDIELCTGCHRVGSKNTKYALKVVSIEDPKDYEFKSWMRLKGGKLRLHDMISGHALSDSDPIKLQKAIAYLKKCSDPSTYTECFADSVPVDGNPLPTSAQQ